ncbi:DUF3549 family protein [Shewanella submarina]|uniref:DUF3549 family protein n=1 Tax=Shewanella submarina TaxID=2016376 RepID=A0ABV7GNH1_9GAMM|nr:DUF3549 family protein [Shewanella submarina]MCL1036354.1 DUF3549 family protein [Shewanella submarina]
MTELNTLGDLLGAANSQFQIYDLGRRVQHIDMMAFHQIEAMTTPYPYPIQGHAQFAVVFWNQHKQEFVWFLKLPLDEQGLLNPAARTQFIKMVLEALGQDLTQALSEDQQQQMGNHPFAFKPGQEKLAVFNALVRKQLGQQASSQYEFAMQYLTGQIPAQQWQQLGFQGLADICIRLTDLDHLQAISQGLQQGADEAVVAMCQCLEHVYLPDTLAAEVLQKLKSSPELRLMLLRALASRPEESAQAIIWLEQQGMLDADALLTIAARNWLALKQEQARTIYFEALALQEQHFFNQIFADIVSIPALRTEMLGTIRNPDRSPQLSAAIGGLFRATRT